MNISIKELAILTYLAKQPIIEVENEFLEELSPEAQKILKRLILVKTPKKVVSIKRPLVSNNERKFGTPKNSA